MTLVADESVERQIVDRLRLDGHQVHFVAEMEPGVSDDIVLDLSNEAQAPLVTADTDFGELVFRQRRVSCGVLLVRLAGLSADRKADIAASAVRCHASELQDAFVVVSPSHVRIRRRPV